MGGGGQRLPGSEPSGVLTQCQKGKTSAVVLEKQLLLRVNVEMGHKTILFNNLGFRIVHEGKTFKTAVRLPKFTSKVRPCP